LWFGVEVKGSRMFDVFANKFSYDVFLQKYSKDQIETWEDTCRRVVSSVCSQLVDEVTKNHILEIMLSRKFIPGGRYLYSAGREFHQVNNCFLFGVEDSREGWADLLYKATMCLMTGGGIGCEYSNLRPNGTKIVRTGGISTGSLALMNMVNEAGRYIMQAGQRRSAIWAGLNWNHGDIDKFLDLKNYSVDMREMKRRDLTFPLPMELTNISVVYDTEFFIAIENKDHPKHQHAKRIWNLNCRQAFETAEPGMSFNFSKDNEKYRNACQPGFATVLTPSGIRTINDISIGSSIWSGSQWTTVVNKWSTGIKPVNKYKTTTGIFLGTENHRVVQEGEKLEVRDAQSIDWSLGPASNKEQLNIQDIMDGLVIGDGSVHKASNNLVILYIGKKDTDYFSSEINSLITKERPGIAKNVFEIDTTIQWQELPKTFLRTVPDRFFYGTAQKKKGFLRGLFSANGSLAGGRVSLKQASKELILQVQQMLSSLGIHSYVTTNKSRTNVFSNGTYVMKESYDLNITSGRSLFRDTIGFIQKYKQENIEEGNRQRYLTSDIKEIEYLGEYEVFDLTVDCKEHTYWTGGCLVSNCTEVTTCDDSDKCNLGTVWLNRINSTKEFRKVVHYATIFLMCGGVYSDTPTEKVKQVGLRNNRIGLGLGGIHEWLIKNKYEYEVPPELHKYLSIYKEESDATAFVTAKELHVAIPKGVRAIAPNGSIGILAESSTGIEPLFCKAYKRRYFKEGTWHYQYVIDGAVKRLTEAGIKPEQIKDSYDLGFKQRVKFQADIQNYVDMAISSTCNMPAWGTETNNESNVQEKANILLKYARRLRGFTCYPDGCRDGQPLERIDLTEALAKEGIVFEEKEDSCIGGICGI
jgi:ribonucleotide reductase alpha subunit